MDTPQDERQLKRVTRRQLLTLTPLVVLGAFAVPKLRRPLLMGGQNFSDWASAQLFRTRHPTTTFPDSDLTPLGRFPYNSYDVDDPEIDLESWTLTVSGLVKKPGAYTLAQIQALPKVAQNTRHVCVEGWDVIGNFAGARLVDFLALVGADLHARFLTFACADDYYESLDMPSAVHLQSLLCYEMYGRPLLPGHGAPLRLSLPTKLGYKSAKYLTQLTVTNELGDRRGYWVDQGYSWFAGL